MSWTAGIRCRIRFMAVFAAIMFLHIQIMLSFLLVTTTIGEFYSVTIVSGIFSMIPCSKNQFNDNDNDQLSLADGTVCEVVAVKQVLHSYWLLLSEFVLIKTFNVCFVLALSVNFNLSLSQGTTYSRKMVVLKTLTTPCLSLGHFSF